jgi:hypothetical protein
MLRWKAVILLLGIALQAVFADGWPAWLSGR